MLTTLRIKNLALVSDLTVEFRPGFNALTGETGAGKSIIIGALNLLLGERADRTLIRSGTDGCTVEGAFDISKLKAPLPEFLEENGLEPCEDGQLVIKRTFTATGTNRQFVNGSPTTLKTLGSLGEWLVDMHGPHEHQSLLHAAKQLEILDSFGGLAEARAQFAALVKQRQELEASKADLVIDERTYAQQLDLLRHQVNEITAARLKPDEEAGLDEEYQRGTNSVRLLELSRSAIDALSEAEGNIMDQLGAVGRVLNELQRIDSTTGSLTEQHAAIVSSLNDLQHELTQYADRVDIDPERVAEVEQRLNLIHSLKRKYGSTLEAVIAFGNESAEKLQQLESRDAELERINNAIAKLNKQLLETGKDLSAKRKKLVPKLSKAVVVQLNDLGFQQSHFDVRIESATEVSDEKLPASSGLDTIEFLFAPNPGEPAHPLRAIASSGEMARVMLALKTVLAAHDQIPVLVFDEVDANVGGETANAVGDKMRQIGANRQALCITHLAPVAACADAHYVVSKKVAEGRTTTSLELLDAKARVSELARMLGGQSTEARTHAEALLKAAR